MSILTGHMLMIHILQAAASLALSEPRSCCFVGPSTLSSHPSWEPMRFVCVVFRRSALLLSEFLWVSLYCQGNEPESFHQFYSDEDTMLQFGRLTQIFTSLKNYTKVTFTFNLPVVQFHFPPRLQWNKTQWSISRSCDLSSLSLTMTLSRIPRLSIFFLSEQISFEWNKCLSLTGVRVHVWWWSAGGTSSRAWPHCLDRLLAWTRNMGLF